MYNHFVFGDLRLCFVSLSLSGRPKPFDCDVYIIIKYNNLYTSTATFVSHYIILIYYKTNVYKIILLIIPLRTHSHFIILIMVAVRTFKYIIIWKVVIFCANRNKIMYGSGMWPRLALIPGLRLRGRGLWVRTHIYYNIQYLHIYMIRRREKVLAFRNPIYIK